MDAKQEDKLGMAIKTNVYLTNNAATVASNTAIATSNTALKTAIDNVINADSTATRNLKGFAEEKSLKRDKLEKSMLTVSAACLGYYTTNADRSKQLVVRFTKTDIERCRDADLLVNADQVSDVATPIVASLAAWGVTATTLTAFAADVAAFRDWIRKPRLEQINSQVAGSQVDEYFADIDDELVKLDNQMEVYAYTNESLFLGYSLCRAIDDSGGGSDSSNFNLQNTAIAANATLTIYTGAIDASKRFYIRFISSPDNKVRMCTDDAANIACSGGFIAMSNNTYKKLIADYNLDPTKNNITITSFSSEDSEVRWGWEL